MDGEEGLEDEEELRTLTKTVLNRISKEEAFGLLAKESGIWKIENVAELSTMMKAKAIILLCLFWGPVVVSEVCLKLRRLTTIMSFTYKVECPAKPIVLMGLVDRDITDYLEIIQEDGRVFLKSNLTLFCSLLLF